MHADLEKNDTRVVEMKEVYGINDISYQTNEDSEVKIWYWSYFDLTLI